MSDISAPPNAIATDHTRDFSDVDRHWAAHARTGDFQSEHGGVSIAYAVAEVDGADRAIVLCPGRTEYYTKYKETTRDLNLAGYSVFIIDHRGQGFSGRMLDNRDIGHVEDFEYYVDDLKHFITRVVQPSRFRRLALVCHSMGGAIGARYLERVEHAGPFQAAVLASPMLGLPHSGILVRCLLWILATFRDEGYVPGGADFDPEAAVSLDENDACTSSAARKAYVGSELIAHREAAIGAPSVRWVRQAIQATHTILDRAHRLAIPTLILSAGDDPVVDNRGQHAFHQAVDQRNPGLCRLETIPGARHELFIEADAFRNDAMERLLAYLDEQLAK